MKFLNRSNTPLLYALLAGAALPFAFAPYRLWLLAFISPAILLSLWQNAPPKRAFQLGYAYGLGMFGFGVTWVYVSIHEFGNTDAITASFITLLLVASFSLYPAFHGLLLKYCYKKSNAFLWFVGFPTSWVLFEWLRGWLFTGFPWLYLGYPQIDTWLGNYAPLLSVYGVSLAVVFCSGCLVALRKGNTSVRVLAVLFISLVWGGGYYFQSKIWTYREGQKQSVSLIQGNVDPLHKFAQNDPIKATDAVYGKLTSSEWWTDIIVWPENAIAYPLPHSQNYLDELNSKAKKNDSTLIVGIQTSIPNNGYYNSLVAVGKGQGAYHKYHLLPFGDFLPFDGYLRGLINFFDLPMSDFSAGPKDQPLIKTDGIKLEPLICYEIAFPELVRDNLKDANAIINISEDGWFGASKGPHQHLEIARMRAKEVARPILRATTSGISAIIDFQGRVVGVAPQFQATILRGTLQGAAGDTPWVKWGPIPLLASLIIAFVLFIFTNRLKFH